MTVETGSRIQSRASLQDAEMDRDWMCVGARGDESPGYTRAVPSGRCVWGRLACPGLLYDQINRSRWKP